MISLREPSFAISLMRQMLLKPESAGWHGVLSDNLNSYCPQLAPNLGGHSEIWSKEQAVAISLGCFPLIDLPPRRYYCSHLHSNRNAARNFQESHCYLSMAAAI